MMKFTFVFLNVFLLAACASTSARRGIAAEEPAKEQTNLERLKGLLESAKTDCEISVVEQTMNFGAIFPGAKPFPALAVLVKFKRGGQRLYTITEPVVNYTTDRNGAGKPDTVKELFTSNVLESESATKPNLFTYQRYSIGDGKYDSISSVQARTALDGKGPVYGSPDSLCKFE